METKVKVTIERGKDGKYNAFTDYELPGYGLMGFGDTAEAAMADFSVSYDEVCEMMAKDGETAPALSFDFYYDVASFLDFFAEMLSKSGLQKITGINQKQLWHYASGVRKPKPDTVHKIQEGLYSFADAIKRVHFVD
jgi:hypothetical protein